MDGSVERMWCWGKRGWGKIAGMVLKPAALLLGFTFAWHETKSYCIIPPKEVKARKRSSRAQYADIVTLLMMISLIREPRSRES